MEMFSLDKNQILQLNAFVSKVDNNELYLGAIGGAYTYEFTPTNLGIVTKVYYLKGTQSEMMIDITNYDEW